MGTSTALSAASKSIVLSQDEDGGGGGGGGNANDNLVLVNTGSAVYNKTYTVSSVKFIVYEDFFGLGAKTDLSTTTHKVYEHDAGSAYYLVVWNSEAVEWQIFYTSTAPDAIGDDTSLTYASSANREPSFCQTSEDAGDGDFRPDSADADVSYVTP